MPASAVQIVHYFPFNQPYFQHSAHSGSYWILTTKAEPTHVFLSPTRGPQVENTPGQYVPGMESVIWWRQC